MGPSNSYFEGPTPLSGQSPAEPRRGRYGALVTVLHARGVLLPDETERDVWVVDGRLTFTAPQAPADTIASSGWLLPGLVDAHCHIGLAPNGHVADPEAQAAQATAQIARQGTALAAAPVSASAEVRPVRFSV